LDFIVYTRPNITNMPNLIFVNVRIEFGTRHHRFAFILFRVHYYRAQ
jgi:hypothetical protein